MTKPTVHYDKSKGTKIVVGKSATVWPTDHTSELVSNTKFISTSTVLKYTKSTGVFETRNSIYVPIVQPSACVPCCSVL